MSHSSECCCYAAHQETQEIKSPNTHLLTAFCAALGPSQTMIPEDMFVATPRAGAAAAAPQGASFTPSAPQRVPQGAPPGVPPGQAPTPAPAPRISEAAARQALQQVSRLDSMA